MKTPAVLGKAAPKLNPKKADVKSPPEGKGKGKGKSLTAEEKAKTPCIFHQMPSGCVRGAKFAASLGKIGLNLT